MRHATVNATFFLYEWFEDNTYSGRESRIACDWSDCEGGCLESEYFNDNAAIKLINGRQCELPTCPECAVLVDLAIQLREESQSIL